ncbi:cation:proton antiporter [Phyllobacterium sp. 21LDTY02-6]|uniref:cation:proton antiporter n=1 Tax=unclassified Phyllobacterium TaxID=2638441 RepID=UPI002020BE4A|nr:MULTISPECIES: cation:proton antiporter [unclassified Phyllobacterium]MCO4317686.1 cation:proton antiporter [Phyllobacterium sp. 21LDTY02-6]MCX8281465.1 cation:proton antiporter [Phyllobacterium sp. 0TCS1.6C]MCX8292939.1 cation:proton antiporter [Phyllobacterium sp. 0TCS1.6A]
MDTHILLLALFGLVVLLTAWLPMVLKDYPLSLPIICIAFGTIFVWPPLSGVLGENPLDSRYITEKVTEFAVIISLMGAGLKIDRIFGWRSWQTTWRLLAISMPLTILAIAVLGWSYLGLGVASALLLGAALAPTDPVLASDVQVGPPQSGEEKEVRFALTSEAGLNDGLSFPFVHLAIAIAGISAHDGAWFGHWMLYDVIWRIGAGAGIGWGVGKILGYLTFRLPQPAKLARTGDGFVALGITCLSYGLVEIAHGYGFIGVFVAALTLRNAERDSGYHEDLHDFAEQIERLLMMVVLVCFGAAIAEGTVFAALDWRIFATALAIIFLVRPICGWIGLIGSRIPPHEAAAISFFGIRGLGSFYYLAYALGHAGFARADVLWVTVSLVVLISIILHGIAVTPVMRYLERG